MFNLTVTKEMLIPKKKKKDLTLNTGRIRRC